MVRLSDSGLVSASSFSSGGNMQNTLWNKKHLICFGTLLGIKLREKQQQTAHMTFRTSAPSVRANSSVHVLCVLEFYSSKCAVFVQDQKIGDIKDETSESLKEVQDLYQVNYEGFLAVRENHDLLRQDLAKNVTIDINIYGRSDASDLVGTFLGNKSLFLQEPYWKQDSVEYCNPQLLELPPFEYSEEDLHNTLPWTRDAAQGNVRANELEQVSTENLPNVIDSYAAHGELNEVEADERVKTALLPHQKQALNFILTREAGRGQPTLSLWEDISDENGVPLFQHRITGAKRSEAKEALGGILADDMGLGKSLSVLSAIAITLDRAINHIKSGANMTVQEIMSNKTVLPAKSSLILVPSTLLIMNWQDELRKHISDQALSVYEYHGAKRKIGRLDLIKHDVIITTYATLSAEPRRKQPLLHMVNWYRVVLDEAHVIRNPKTRQYKAVVALPCRHRWCLTGTPIQNSLEDLCSLIRFLKVPLLEVPVQFRRHIVNKIENRAKEEQEFDNLRSLLEAICLRRNKSILDVPPCEETRRELAFSREEKQAYSALQQYVRNAMDRAVSGHHSKETHQTVLHALLRLRIFCNNGNFFGPLGNGWLTSSEEVESLLRQSSDEGITCHYCAYDLVSLDGDEDEYCGRVTHCQQFICKHCVQEHRERAKKQSKCPICEKQHDMFLKFTDEIHATTGPFPSKLLDLVEQVQRLRSHGPRNKGIIFSFWKKSLDIVSTLLGTKGIPYLRVDGSLPSQIRSRVLSEFDAVEGNIVLLMTFSIGAVGLNSLSSASHVHILEPQWNPSVESQAIGRLVRLGQKHTVQVVRYLMKDTIEMNVQSRQISKVNLAQDGFDSNTKTWVNAVVGKGPYN